MLYQQYRMVDTWRQMGYSDTLPKDQLFAVLRRQVECLDEEYQELKTAQSKNNIYEVIDAYCDIAWVACMIASIMKYDPIPKFKVLNQGTYNMIPHYEKLHKNLMYLRDHYREIYQDNPRFKNEFQDNVSAIIYRCWNGMIDSLKYHFPHEIAMKKASDCFNDVIFSNYSKAVDGKLVLDTTGKITKSLAKANGTYIDPDFKSIIG